MEQSATITNKEVQRLLSCADSTAKRHLSRLRAALARKRFQKVFLWEFCKFESIDYEYAQKVLKAQ